MSDTVKLIIEIPKRDYEEIKKVGVFTFPRLSKAIREATTLDDVIDKIDKAYDDLDGYDPYALGTFANKVSEILDSIGKAESEDISHIFDNVTQEEFEKIAKELVGWDTEKIHKEIQGEKE